MTALSLASLRQRIRDAPVAENDDNVDDELPPAEPSSSFSWLFRRNESDAAVAAAAPGETILDVPLTRVVSGWGAIVGLAFGILIGLPGGMPGVIAGAILGMMIGSGVAMGGLVALAATASRAGATWTLLLLAFAVGIATWLLTL